MTVEFVGHTVGRNPRVTSMSGGLAASPSDDDYVFWCAFYRNAMTEAWATGSSAGWTQLRKTVGTHRTVELWWRQWQTGDATSWTVDVTGFNPSIPDTGLTMVYRGLVADPTVVSTTNEQSSSPAVVDAVSDASIGNTDAALCFFSAYTGTFTGSTTPALDVAMNAGTTPGILSGHHVPGTVGTAGSVTAPVSGGGFGDLTALQVILPDAPSGGGWGVGFVRMGAN